MRALCAPDPASWSLGSDACLIESGLSCFPQKRFIEAAGEAYEHLIRRLLYFHLADEDDENEIEDDDDDEDEDEEDEDENHRKSKRNGRRRSRQKASSSNGKEANLEQVVSLDERCPSGWTMPVSQQVPKWRPPFARQRQDESNEKKNQPSTSSSANENEVIPEMDFDFYRVLDISNRRWRASQEEIKTAYKAAALRTHPDKLAPEMQGDESAFKKVNFAYAVLSHIPSRAVYDSYDDEAIDDSLPSASLRFSTPEEFFATYGPIFDENAKWSNAGYESVPKLGDMSMDLDLVSDFYDFWFQFSSWRVVMAENEYDLEKAESREERRWMERENDRERKKVRAAESERIRRLVEQAYSSDPRVNALRERAKLKQVEKRRRRQERLDMQFREQELVAQKYREQQEEKEKTRKSQEESERLRLQAEKNEIRNVRRSFRSVISDNPEIIKIFPSGEADLIMRKLDREQLAVFVEKCRSLDGTLLVSNVREKLEELEPLKSSSSSSSVSSISAPSSSVSEWTEDELIELAAGIAKFPGGTTDRWETISAYMGYTKTAQQVLRKSKELEKLAREGHSALGTDAAASFERTVRRNVQKMTGRAREKMTEEEKKAPVNTNSEEAAMKPSSSAPSASAVKNWTKEEQSLLERCLKDFKGLPDMWEKTAAGVGRSVNECKERFKFIRAALQKKKEANQ